MRRNCDCAAFWCSKATVLLTSPDSAYLGFVGLLRLSKYHYRTIWVFGGRQFRITLTPTYMLWYVPTETGVSHPHMHGTIGQQYSLLLITSMELRSPICRWHKLNDLSDWDSFPLLCSCAYLQSYQLQTDSSRCPTSHIPLDTSTMDASRRCAAEINKKIVVQMRRFQVHANCFFVP